ncbi:MAG: YfhO family protein [Clostridia bacterium]|nr:YfhO family protein [Clostridia bacterium]
MAQELNVTVENAGTPTEIKELSAELSHTKKAWNAVKKAWVRVMPVLRRLVWLFPPIIVAVAMSLFFHARKFYPFGDITISWGDMDQQTIPLLLDYKRILADEEGFFFNTRTAGGMNFFGVFFFFISSPFTLFVAFVDENKVALFVNILVLLKMCATSCSASVYFYKKHPKNAFLNIVLSVLYAYSGYTMYYYQNMMWLDVMCLFPLLLLGLDKLKEGKRVLFTVALSACLFVNFYLSYMVVVFLLLYAFVWLIIEKDKRFAKNFIVCCFTAALLTALVWLPSLVQYFSSGRKGSIIENLQNSGIFTSYTTTFPTIFSILFLFPFAVCKSHAKTSDRKLRFILFLLTLVPIALEPINKMWQTGSYMSFPTRYAFLPIFLCMSLAMDCLAQKSDENERILLLNDKPKIWEKIRKGIPMYATSCLLLVVSIWYCAFAVGYTRANRETMDQYAHSLWGNSASFEAQLKLYAIMLAIGVVAYLLWRFRLFKPVLLWVSIAVLAVSELYVAPNVYMRAASHSVERHLQIMELSDKIDDEGFFRVKSEKEYSGYDFDANMMGSIGYNALGHFTSLTNAEYMSAMKLFGYTSYWMEVGNSGGSILSDALLSVKYTIERTTGSGEVYQGKAYGISQTPAYLPLGVISQADIIAAWKPSDGIYPRAEFQQRLAADFFGTDDFVRVYGLDEAILRNLTVEEKDGKYLLTPTGSSGKIIFKVPVDKAQTLYFNAFDENSNALHQAINKKFSLTVAGKTLDYPAQKENGVLRVGEYEETEATVTVTVKEKVTVRDISVFSIENESLAQAVEKTKTVGLQARKNGYVGKYTAEGGECVFLSVGYDAGLTLKINGKKAKLYNVYDGFTAFYLQEGENKIEISYCPPGFAAGMCITLAGIGLVAAACVLWLWKKRRLDLSEKTEKAAYYGLLAVGVAVIVFVYFVPLVLCAT